MMRSWRCLSVLGFMVVLFAALGGAVADAERYGGTIEVALGISPPFLDWHMTTAGATEAPASHIFETLTTFNADFEDIPQLASSWELSEDRLTWTFYLRQGVNFQKGYGELTAEDVKASVERFIRVASRGPDFAAVEEIVVVDPYTIKFELSTPFRLLTALSTGVNGLGIYPKAIIEQYGDEPIPAAGIIGTGPYELEAWTEERVVLRRFDDYTPMTDFAATGYGGHRIAYLDKIVFNYVPEAGARIAGLETGRYHVGTEIPISEAPRLEANPDLELRPFSPYYKPLYFVNCTRWPTSDLRIRQALRVALNMESILRFTAYGFDDFFDANPSPHFIDQPVWYSDACMDEYSPADTDLAKQLMEEAGYDGAEIILVATRDYDWIYREALAAYDQWAAVGFNVTLRVYPWAAFVGNIQVETENNVWFTGLGFPVDPDANAYVYDPRSGHNANLVMGDATTNPVIAEHGFISDAAAQIADLMDQQYATDDYETRYAIWEEIQCLLLEDPFLAIIGDFMGLQVTQSNVSNYQAFKRETFWNVWFDN